MKRAPSCASAALRLRVAGSARARSASSETVSYLARSSARLAEAISPSTPTGSVIARLDEAFEHLDRTARCHCLTRQFRPFAQGCCLACSEQQGSAIENDDVLVGAGGPPCQQRLEPRGIFLNVA